MGKEPMTFGSRLRAARERIGMSRYALAKKTGISQPGLAHLESEDRSPNWTTVQLVRLALGCAFEELADDSLQLPEPPAPKPRGRPAKAEKKARK